jgi:hypothetical protein
MFLVIRIVKIFVEPDKNDNDIVDKGKTERKTERKWGKATTILQWVLVFWWCDDVFKWKTYQNSNGVRVDRNQNKHAKGKTC